jgi:hypothetical protein
MKIICVGRVTDVNHSDNGMSYITFLDVDQGGQFKLSVPGGNDIKVDQKINLDVEVKPGLGQYGMYLKVVKVNSSESDKEGAK